MAFLLYLFEWWLEELPTTIGHTPQESLAETQMRKPLQTMALLEHHLGAWTFSHCRDPRVPWMTGSGGHGHSIIKHLLRREQRMI